MTEANGRKQWRLGGLNIDRLGCCMRPWDKTMVCMELERKTELTATP